MDLLEDDSSHPIPAVGKIDAALTSNKGLRYGLVIASPLLADERSRQRFLAKLEGYVIDLDTRAAEWLEAHDEPMEAWIYIAMHAESAPQMFELLRDREAWLRSRGIEVRVSMVGGGTVQ